MSAHKRGNWAVPSNGRFPGRWLVLGALVLLLAAVVLSCGGGSDGDGGGGSGGDGGPSPTPDEQLSDAELRLQFIRTIGNGFILPTYTAMEAEADDLIEAAEAFCANPNASNLNAAQAQWRNVVGLWVESELVGFGPAKEDLVHNNIDAPRGGHANADGIEARIERGDIDPADPATARRLPLNQRGLEGIEYLLFGDTGEGVTMLDTSDSLWEQRCDFLEAIVINLHDNIALILTRWQASGGGYIDEWNSAGETDNTTYPFIQDAIDDLITEVEFVMDNLVNVKLQQVNWMDGKPESWRSGNSIANVRHRIEAAEMIYLGTDRATGQDGFGIDEYLQRTGEAGLASQIRSQFDASYAALAAIPGTLEEAPIPIVDEAEAASRVLLRLLKRQMAEHLDVFFGFNDADGD